MLSRKLLSELSAGNETGQVTYTTAGTYTFVVPKNVTSICAMAVGGGGASLPFNGLGGGGGALSYINNYAVTPMQRLTVVVPSQATADGVSGGDASISIGGTTILLAKGGQGGTAGGAGGAAASGIGDVKYSGGNAGADAGVTGAGGGGGAAGYAGNGGNGGAATGAAGAAGAGGGGGGGYSNGLGGSSTDVGGGGGVGLLGQGANGAGGTAANGGGGKGGSGGADSGLDNSADGGNYGGGGAGFYSSANNSGGLGAVRIIWGNGRFYPSTYTEDVTSITIPTFTYLASYSDASSQTTRTISSVNFGDASTTREIFVVTRWTSTASRSVNSMTIGGVSATESSSVVEATTQGMAVFFATVPSGTSGDIVLNYSGATTNAVTFVYRVTDRENIGTNQFSSSGDQSVQTRTSYTSNSITFPANGFALACFTHSTTTDLTFTSDILTKNEEVALSGERVAFSYNNIGSAQFSSTYSVSWGGLSGSTVARIWTFN